MIQTIDLNTLAAAFSSLAHPKPKATQEEVNKFFSVLAHAAG
jgi:hypothetical protein